VEAIEFEYDETVPTVNVGDKTIAITDVNDTLIAEMTSTEKEIYIKTYQDYYSHIYD